MKKICLRIALVLVPVLSLLPAKAGRLPAPFSLIPEPKSVGIVPGRGFSLRQLTAIRLADGLSLPVLGTILSALPVDNAQGRLSLELTIDSSRFPSREGYELRIGRDRISIVARGEAGLFYGCQSLEQLLEDASRFHRDLPAMTVTDFPSMTYRAVHFDVKHHLDHLDYYYRSIDRLARYKINAVVFEFEDKLRYRRQPLVGGPNAMSIEEMAALTEYARKRFIEITPLVQGLGHASFILKHEAYAPLRELTWNDWAFCPMNESTYQVLFDLYRDAIDATPGSRYLHIGGDEVGNIGLCERCRPFVEANGMGKLHLYWLNRVCRFAAEHGRIPIFWDDMPLQEAGLYESTWNEKIGQAEADSLWRVHRPALDSLLPSLPSPGVFMRWNYSVADQPGNLLCLDWYAKSGLPVMVATATNGEGGMLFEPDIRDSGFASAGNSCIRRFLGLAAARGIGGMLCTAWDDKSPHMENYWPGFIAAAEYSWSPGLKSLEDFDRAWADKEFGLSIPDWVTLQRALRKGSELWYEALFEKGTWMEDDNMLQSLKQVEHWLKPVEGRERQVFDYSTKIIGLPDPQAPGRWTARYADKLRKAEQVVRDYPRLMARLNELERRSSRNRYFWRLSAALCRFQTATPALLLALKAGDRADTRDPVASLAAARAEMSRSFEHLVAVYAETRFVKQPEGFVKDRYFHTASQREDLTWMTQAQEIFCDKIDRWLKSDR